MELEISRDSNFEANIAKINSSFLNNSFDQKTNLNKSDFKNQIQEVERLKHILKCISKTDYKSKIKILNQITQIHPSFRAWVDLGNAYYKIEDFKSALKSYYEAFKVVDYKKIDLYEAYKNVGNILAKEGDFDGATEYYHKSLSINPYSDSLLVNLGTLDIQYEDWSEALNRFRQAINVNPKNDKAWVGLAIVHNKMSDFDLAKANIETAVDLCPSNRTAIQLAATWAIQDSRYGRAIEILSNYLHTVPVDEDMSILLIHCLEKQGFLEVALFECEKVLLWNPHNATIQTIEQELKNAIR